MGGVITDYKAIVWELGAGASNPPHHVTVSARDKVEARLRLEERFGIDIHCSIWSEEESRARRPPLVESDEVRPYEALVWTKDPQKPKQRLTVYARSGREAKEILRAQSTEEIFISVWNEEDAKWIR